MYALVTSAGSLGGNSVIDDPFPAPPKLGFSLGTYPQRTLSTSQWMRALWFRYDSSNSAGSSYDFVGIPLWAMAILFGILPVLQARRRLRPWKPGYCSICGYDLLRLAR